MSDVDEGVITAYLVQVLRRQTIIIKNQNLTLEFLMLINPRTRKA